MIKVNLTKDADYPVSATALKKRLREFLTKEGIVSDSLVSVSLVGKREMQKLSQKYLRDREEHAVFAFPESEVRGRFIYPDNAIRLGEIIVCVPQAVNEAADKGLLTENYIGELIEHAALHLLGKNHDFVS